MPVISKITVPGDNTYDITDNSKLPKTTHEWNKEVYMGGSGYVKIGSFPMYDTNITINIDATTSSTFHGTVVIATQNVSTTSIGSAHNICVYGDPTGTIASSLRIVWTSGSRNYDIYFVPQAWSKNFIHIRGLGKYLDGATDVCVEVSSGLPPSTTSGLEPKNMLEPPYFGNGLASCSTAEATVAKLASLSGYTLHDHGIVSVKFTNAVPANSTLNINSKGAKSIYYQGSAITGDVIKAGDVATFIYSTQYHLIAIDRWGKYIDEVHAPLKELVDNGAKNLIKLGFSPKTVGTVTGTMTADGNGIIINGERTLTTEIMLIYDIITDKSLSVNARYTLPVGKYVLAAATAYAQIQVCAHDGLVENIETLAQAGDSAVEFEYTSAKKLEKPYLCIRVLIKGSHNYENETIYPMICTKAQWDISHTYEPYALANPELTAKLKDDEAALVEIVNDGNKNKLRYNGIGAKQGNADNISFTYNSDGSITVNGSVDSTGTAYVYLQLNGASINAHGTPDFCTGDFVLSGCPKNENGLSLRTTGTGYDTSSDTGEGVVIKPASSGVTVRIAIMVAKGSTISNLTVKPMICTKAAWRVSQTYEPYKPDDYVGNELQSGDDLNNLSIGRYYCRSAAISAQILNNPNTGSGFVLDNMYNGNIVQMLYPVSSNNTMFYKRSYAGSVWRPWCRFEGTEVT